MSAVPAAGPDTPADGAPAVAGTGAGHHAETAGRREDGKPARAGHRPGWLSLSNWPVAVRLIAVFAVASLTGLVFGGLRIMDACGTAHAYGQVAELSVLGKDNTLLEQNLENERDLAIGAAAMTVLQKDATAAKAGTAVTASLRQTATTEQRQLATAQQATSAAAVPVRQLAMDVTTGSAFPSSIHGSADTVVSQVDNLDEIRSEAINQSPAQIFANYADTISALLALNDESTSSSGDAQLSDEVRALGALSRAKDQAAQQRAILFAAFIMSGLNDAGGEPGTAGLAQAPYNNVSGTAALNYAGGLQSLNTAQSLQLSDLQTFQLSTTPADFNAYLAIVSGPQVETAKTIGNIVTTSNGNVRSVFPQTAKLLSGFGPATAAGLWYTDQSAVVNSLRTVENQLATQIVARSQLLRHEAVESAIITSAVTVPALLLVLLATTLVGRTLVNPLRRLKADALEIASIRLPARVAAAAADTEGAEGLPVVEPVGVQSTDEIGQVARAFDQVHAEAVRLAGNEAQLRNSLNAMFISLSRRSVPLIARLAGMIDTMEQTEDDPDQLAKLFSMDHMVTRMRRNSESLLVLAGEEPVRKWTEPVPLTDVTRAASSEIEQYSRVALADQPGMMISGHAAADVVHLLAELIENATLFSPQHTQVQVTVQEVSTGGVLVEVRDDGVGISPSRLADMNWRLDNPPVIDVSVSRHMGLYAVSRLAARHGIRVRLRPGTPHGLSALVWLPAAIANREPAPASPSGPFEPFGIDPAEPTEAGRPAVPPRHGPGRHRSGAHAAAGDRAPHGATAAPGERATRPGTAWFAAKRPSISAPRSAEELTAGWRSATSGMAAADRTDASEQAGQTASGLPRRVPRRNAYPGSDTPGSGLNVTAAVDAGGSGVPFLGAPPGETAALGVPSQQAAPYQEQPLPRRRSPEAARSRLSGFQLGGRDAVQSGHAAASTPRTGEGNGR